MYRKIFSVRQVIYVNLFNTKLTHHWHSVLNISKTIRCYSINDRNNYFFYKITSLYTN